MGCLFLFFSAGFPRLALILVWIARPALVASAFGDFLLWPLLGLIFLPFTTLLFVFMSRGLDSLSGLDILLLILAIGLDVSHAGASAYSNRDRVANSGNM